MARLHPNTPEGIAVGALTIIAGLGQQIVRVARGGASPSQRRDISAGFSFTGRKLEEADVALHHVRRRNKFRFGSGSVIMC